MSFILKNSPEILITMKVKLLCCCIIVVFHTSFCRGDGTSDDDDDENFLATEEWKIVKKGKCVYILRSIQSHSLQQFVFNMCCEESANNEIDLISCCWGEGRHMTLLPICITYNSF